jgi:hypothetical protein
MNDNLSGFYILDNNIDCSDTTNWNSGSGFLPIGNSSTPFAGHLEGNGKTISNLYIHRPSTDDVGLFGYVDTGDFPFELSDLTITGTIAGKDYIGTLAGEIYGYSISIDNVNTDSTIVSVGRLVVGGLIGYMETTAGDIRVSDSSASGDITVSSATTVNDVAGLISEMYPNGNIYITNSHYSGNINIRATTGARWGMGGLLGDVGSTATVYNSYTTGTITVVAGTYIESVAGLLGSVYSPTTITNSYSTSDISVTAGTYTDYGISGFFGYANDLTTISNSFSAGSVTVNAGSYASHIGGFIGIWDYNSLNVSNSYSTSNIVVNASTTITSVGGFIGAVNDCCSAATGQSISNSFSTGSLTLNSLTNDLVTVGGFIGSYDLSTTFYNNFFSPSLSTIDLCTGQDVTDPSGCTATTNTFKGSSSYAPLSSWNFSTIWSLVEGNYPNLTSLPSVFTAIVSPVVTPERHSSSGSKSTVAKSKSPTVTPVTPTQLQSKPTFPRDLILGTTGPDVKLLQIYLNTHGYPVAITGPGSKGQETLLFGGLTKKAVIKYQRDHGLPGTGFFGPRTRGSVK